MEQHKIQRINELYRKHKSGTLTVAETKERKELHREYVEALKRNLVSQLENTYVAEPDGGKRKLGKKD